jgi:two-component system LytT family response regulator
VEKLRTIIVDDEELARRLLRVSLAKIPQIEIIAECENGREAVTVIQALNPDLVLLDIQMPGLNGFDVVKALQSDVVPLIVFCTAFEQYAIDAFDLHAVDYLLKPYDQQRLLRAVQRAQTRVEEDSHEDDYKGPLIGAIDDITHKISVADAVGATEAVTANIALDSKIIIRDAGGSLIINADEIDWVDAAGDYMCIHVQGATHIMRSTMKELLDKLDRRIFARIHRSTIVNKGRIVAVKHHAKGEYFIDLNCGERLKVSRNFREAIKPFLDK